MSFPIDSKGLYFMFGKKGAGKSCLLARLAREGKKKGMVVFTTIPLHGTFLFNPRDFGKFEFPENSLCLMDEVNMFWDNRNFKNFEDFTQNLLRDQRHYGLTVFMFSQSFDVDRKIKTLADGLFIVKRISRWFSYVKTIDKDFIVTKPTDYGGSDISFGMWIRPFVLKDARNIVFLPRYWHDYDSFVKRDLDEPQKYVTWIN